MPALQAVSKCRSCGLVQYPFDFQTGYLSRVLCSLSLPVIKIRWDGYDSFRDFLAKILLSIFLEFSQDHGRDLRGCMVFSVYLHCHDFIFTALDYIRHHGHLFLDFIDEPAHEPFY